ncbi:MAG: radical SAM protein [Luteitalea sp.]|nr:radical SAM protein [Luteitalea sp.]
MVTLTVNEIYCSIQGESTWAGLPCVFVRLTACNLRCAWCDTPHAFYEGRKWSVEDVCAEVDRHHCNLVELTGGEPLLQEGVYTLMHRLLASGRTVLLETGGHMSLARVPVEVVRIMDVKCPGSSEEMRNDWSNIDRLTRRDEVKFVIKDRADYEYARDVVKRHALSGRVHALLFSPVYGVLEPKTLAAWLVADGLAARLQLQLHKYIWAPEARGV